MIAQIDEGKFSIEKTMCCARNPAAEDSSTGIGVAYCCG